MRLCRSFADVAQLVEHFTRKGLQPFGGTGRRMAQQSRFAAVSCVAARTIRLSYAIGFGPVWAPLAVSAQYGVSGRAGSLERRARPEQLRSQATAEALRSRRDAGNAAGACCSAAVLLARSRGR